MNVDMFNSKGNSNQEIFLSDLLLCAWKRKWIIFGTVVVSALLGAYIIHRMPDIYRASAVISPCIVDISSEGKFVYMDSAEDMKEKIDSHFYDRKIQDSIRADKKGSSDISMLTINAEVSGKGKFLDISTEYTGENAGIGVLVLDHLIDEIQKDCSLMIERKKSDLLKRGFQIENQISKLLGERKEVDKEISLINMRREKYRDMMESRQSILLILQQSERELAEELKQARTTEKTIHKRYDDFLKNMPVSEKQEMNGILYMAGINQNTGNINELMNRLNETRMRIENYKLSIKSCKRSIEEEELKAEKASLKKTDDLDLQIYVKRDEIGDLKKRLDYLQNVSVVSRPTASSSPIKPNRTKYMTAVLLTGLFLGLVLAFFIESLSARKTSGR